MNLFHINVTCDIFSGARLVRCGPIGSDVVISHTSHGEIDGAKKQSKEEKRVQ